MKKQRYEGWVAGRHEGRVWRGGGARIDGDKGCCPPRRSQRGTCSLLRERLGCREDSGVALRDIAPIRTSHDANKLHGTPHPSDHTRAAQTARRAAVCSYVSWKLLYVFVLYVIYIFRLFAYSYYLHFALIVHVAVALRTCAPTTPPSSRGEEGC
jgi:hypothetical protein